MCIWGFVTGKRGLFSTTHHMCWCWELSKRGAAPLQHSLAKRRASCCITHQMGNAGYSRLAALREGALVGYWLSACWQGWPVYAFVC